MGRELWGGIAYWLASVGVDEISPEAELAEGVAHVHGGADEGLGELLTLSGHVLVPVEDVVLGAVREGDGVHVDLGQVHTGEEGAEVGLQQGRAVVHLNREKLRVDGWHEGSDTGDNRLQK